MKESTGTWGNGFPGEFTEEEIYEFFNTGILKDNSKYMKLRKDMAKYAYWYYKLLVKRYSLSEVMDKNLRSLLSITIVSELVVGLNFIAKNNDVAFPAFVLVNLAGLFLVKIIPRVVAMKEYFRYSNLVYQGCDDYFDKLLEDAGIMEDFSTKLVMDNNSNKESRTLNLSRAKRV